MVEKKTEKSVKNNSLLQLVLTLLLVGAAFAVGSMWTEIRMIKGGKTETAAVKQSPQPSAGPEEEGPLTEEQWQEVLANPAYSEGDENAPVTLVEFTDYQCPFCKRHFDQTEKQLNTEYIKTGKVRWIFRDLPLSFHQNAAPAAEAARCAGEQEKYKAMHDELFSSQATWSAAADPATLFSGYARVIGLNTAAFDVCYSSGKYKEAVQADLELAKKINAGGTPTFYINAKPLVGAQPFSAFKTAIEAELTE